MPVPLNTVPTVARLVESLAKAVFERLGTGGTSDNSEFDDWLRSECAELNALFLGAETTLSKEFIRTEWNSPSQLGQAVRNATYTTGDPSNAVAEVCFACVGEMLVIVIGEGMAKVEEWGWKIQALCETLTANLLGYRDGFNADMYVAVGVGSPVTLEDFEQYFAVVDRDEEGRNYAWQVAR